jgi:hypothetical protein
VQPALETGLKYDAIAGKVGKITVNPFGEHQGISPGICSDDESDLRRPILKDRTG